MLLHEILLLSFYNIEIPLRLKLLLIGIVDEGASGGIVTSSENSRRCSLLGKALNVGVGRVLRRVRWIGTKPF
jgi:hypothetical protein